MEYQEWYELGRQQGFISPAVCSTHDGIPMSDEEIALFDDGDDPCIHVLRLYEDKEKAAQVEPNVPVWRV